MIIITDNVTNVNTITEESENVDLLSLMKRV